MQGRKPAAFDDADRAHMAHALTLARRGLGQTAPNPAVGCVIVKDGVIVGRGRTAPGGRPHAETEALAMAGERARGATAYVTLEPCAHKGRTGPCAAALVKAGVARIVIALLDPDPRVDGGGAAMLEAAGIHVDLGLMADEAETLNRGFLHRVREGRPAVILKLASTLDGRIATRTHESRWITGEASRARAHLMRAQADAILVGSRTAIVDNPDLTCRLPGLEGVSPLRVVADGRMRLPLTHRLVATAKDTPTVLLVLAGGDSSRRAAFEGAGVRVMEVPEGEKGHMDLAAALRLLGNEGITRVLCEGGATLAAELLRARMADVLHWFHGPMLIGADGLAAVAGLGVASMSETVRLSRIRTEALGEDVLSTYLVSS